MATYSKAKLSGSTDGLHIKVTGTATGSANTIHTAVSGTTNFDEVWIYATNTSASNVVLTIEWGEATAPDGNLIVTIPAQQGYVLVVPGLVLQNSKVVKAFAATTAVINIAGFVNAITA